MRTRFSILEGDGVVRLTVGQTLVSTVDQTTVIVVRAPEGEAALTCGGVEMVDAKGERPAHEADPTQQDGTLLGKRYADEAAGLELLCSKAGTGTLAYAGAPLPVKDAKALPASD
jgi:hypothetical protein